jgi:hypothetical protein
VRNDYVKIMGLIQLVRFLVIELTHLYLNPRFNMYIIFMTNYFFSGRRHPIDSETFLVTDFINLKIKPTQSFKCAHKNMMCAFI